MKPSEERQKKHGGMLRDERGILLVSLAMIFALAAVFITVAATRTAQDRQATAIRSENMESSYAAQAGEQAMKAAIRRDALARFAAFQAAWAGAGSILTNPGAFFANQVTLPGVRLPTGAAFPAVQANLTFVNSNITALRQVYNFTYTITSQGTDPDNADRFTTLVTNGNFQIQVERQSFANYALFTGTHTMTNGTRVWFTSNTNFTGRVHTNSRFAFAYNPTFSNGLVSSVANDAYFYNNGNSRLLQADSNPPRDVPVFGNGFQRGAGAITLPPNAFDQRTAAVGGTAADNAELRIRLGLPTDSTPPPSGIYVPNDGSSLTGGIYVQGDAGNVLLSVDTSDRQCYQITHSSGSTSNIVVDRANNRTTVNSVMYQGVPNGALYVAGNVSSLGGPSRAGDGTRPPAIQSDSGLTLISEGNVVITRDIVYEENPLSVADATNIFGIFTPGGSIRIGTTAPNDVVIDGSLMTSSSTGVIQVDNYNQGSPRGTATIFGGAIMTYYGAFGTFGASGQLTGYARNFVYDQRLTGGLAPPYFPTTSIFLPATSNVNQITWDSRRQYIPGNSGNFVMPTGTPNFNPDFRGA